MGTCPYKLKMVELLDPKKMYFSSRVIAQEDWTQKNKKRLDVIPGKESAILILDDKEKAWKKHKENLILMAGYQFFASSRHRSGRETKNSTSDASASGTIVKRPKGMVTSMVSTNHSEKPEKFHG
nr:RNA polymerase II C-terminal domain phosphatase-like 4 [Coffea arabica]